MKRVCVITGSRADYGLLRPLMNKLHNDNGLQLQVVATGAHLSPEFGLTYQAIEEDGYVIDERIEIVLSSDSTVGRSKSMGLAMISFCECYERLKPHMIVVLGDRYEIFAAVSAASVARIPVAHLHGGETTEGAFDEAFRHSITKMSYLHFTSTDSYRNRVIQLGEAPDRVFNVGALGIENIRSMPLLSKAEVEEQLGFRFGHRTIVVTFHPVTLEESTSESQFSNLLQAIEAFEQLSIIFTKANSDTDGRKINAMIDHYVADHIGKAIAFTSMGQTRYLSALQYVDAVVGNSSSGIIEAPSFHVPTINIGDRQKGRIQADSIVNCRANKDEIIDSLNKVLSADFKSSIQNGGNPYEKVNTSERIVTQIKQALQKGIQLKKTFYDL
jgi:GDP/UDP-N,N'-diacetylbacillosamine 2-epimerase (hydrolysing)